MSDPINDETTELRAWKASVEEGRAPAFMDSVLKPAAASGVQVMVARADMIFGKDHVRSALYHAKRAIREGSNSSDSLAMEVLLYTSGERQLSSAIKKMSVDGRTKEVVIAQLSAGTLARDRSWRELGDLPDDVTPERLIEFGVSRQELETLVPERAVELILEKVASVDILKK